MIAKRLADALTQIEWLRGRIRDLEAKAEAAAPAPTEAELQRARDDAAVRTLSTRNLARAGEVIAAQTIAAQQAWESHRKALAQASEAMTAGTLAAPQVSEPGTVTHDHEPSAPPHGEKA
jgi:small-conductance mechanosensitive channel